MGNSYGYKPVNTVAPVVSGTTTVGQTLSTTNGTWNAAPAAITYTYQWQRNTSNIGGATSSTYVLQSADAGNTVRCVVTATNAVGATSANSNSTGTIVAVTGQQAYTSAGSYTWVAPTGVTSVSVVAVGGGGRSGTTTYSGGGAGGGLGWKNNITVTPGSSYTVVVGAGATVQTSAGGDSYFNNTSTVAGYGGYSAAQDNTGSTYNNGGGYTGDGGGNGGRAGRNGAGPRGYAGGAGAGGYAGAGGDGGYLSIIPDRLPTAGAGGGGGGGAVWDSSNKGAGGGGGVGILGQGSNGAAGLQTSTAAATAGGGGSGGSNGGPAQGYKNASGGPGGAYGGGGGGSYGGSNPAAVGGVGAVRIIWPGNTRSFPSTNTGNL